MDPVFTTCLTNDVLDDLETQITYAQPPIPEQDIIINPEKMYKQYLRPE